MSDQRKSGEKRPRSASPEGPSTSSKRRRVERVGGKRPRSASPEGPSTSSKRRRVERVGGKRPRSASPEGPSTSSKRRRVERVGGKRPRSASPEGPSTSSKRRRVERVGGKRSRSPSSERPSTSFKATIFSQQRRTAERRVTCIQDIPFEIMEIILGHLSPQDIRSFGATCTRYHQQSQSPWVWKRVCGCMPDPSKPSEWQRLAILKYTQALHTHGLDVAQQAPPSRAIDLPGAHGYQRMMLGRDCVLVLDYQGTLHLLREVRGAGELSQPTVLCRDVMDFAVEPRRDVTYSVLVHVLVRPKDSDGTGGSPGSTLLRVYHQRTGECVYNVRIPASMAFTQLCLTGPESPRQLLLLCVTGEVFAFNQDEFRLEFTRMNARIIGAPHGQEPIRHVYSSHGSALYLTAEGSAFLEVYSQYRYRKMFGLDQLLCALYTPVHLPTLNKVVNCWLGPGHLCLVDELGGLFTQGVNNYGQLGAGDRVDRTQLTQVAVSMRPVDVWCGLNHTLVLLQDESGAKELHGCGCGAGGRLPGFPEGSDMLVKLNVQVPRTAHSICATISCLHLLSCHDIAEPLLGDTGPQ